MKASFAAARRKGNDGRSTRGGGRDDHRRFEAVGAVCRGVQAIVCGALVEGGRGTVSPSVSTSDTPQPQEFRSGLGRGRRGERRRTARPPSWSASPSQSPAAV